MSSKLEKLKKLRSLSEDFRATNSEREIAYKKYIEYKAKYGLDDEEEEQEYTLKAISKQEFYLLIAIIYSFKLEPYKYKNKSTLRIYFKSTKNKFIAIKDEFDYHKSKLKEILNGITMKYIHSQVKAPSIDEESNRTDENLIIPSEEFLKAYNLNTWLDSENYKNNLKIEEQDMEGKWNI